MRHQQPAVSDRPHKKTMTTLDKHNHDKAPNKQSTVSPFISIPKSVHSRHDASRDKFQALIQRARVQNAKQTSKKPKTHVDRLREQSKEQSKIMLAHTQQNKAGSTFNSASKTNHAQSHNEHDTISAKDAEHALAGRLKKPSTQIFPRQDAPGTKHVECTSADNARNPYAQIPTLESDTEQSESEDEAPVEPPTGPFALHSKQGVEVVRKLVPKTVVHPNQANNTATAAARFMGNKPPPKITMKKSAHDSLPITAIDLKVYQWRQQKVIWEEVRERHAQLSGGEYHSEHKLLQRWRFVQKAIDVEEITSELCQDVIDGKEGAEAELTRLVTLNKPELADLDSRPFQKTSKVKVDDAKPVVAESSNPTPILDIAPQPRPTQGGKTLNWETCLAYTTQMAEQWGELEDSDDEGTTRGASPMAEEDAVHWEYFLQRRDLAAEEFAENDEASLEDIEWREYDAGFEEVTEANAQATRFIFATPEGNQLFTAESDFVLQHSRDENGMVHLTRQSNLGTAEVRVVRRMRTYQQHIMPESKEGWLDKTLYCVQVKTTRKPQHALFDPAEVTARTLDNGVFTSLDFANSRAIDEWLRLTLKPSSARLDQVQIERAEAKAELLRVLEDEGEGVVFQKSAEDDEECVEVFVRTLQLQGPRN